MAILTSSKPQTGISSISLPAIAGFGGMLRWIMALAVLQGAIFTFLMPPWQHYDEPNHFEYALILAHGPDQDLSRRVADSMYRHRFWPDGFTPDLIGLDFQLEGSKQQVHPDTYYRIVASMIAPLRYFPIELQLYAARSFSFVLYLFTVLIAWRLAVVAAPDEPQVHFILPALLIATPSFADLMTAVNSDVLLNFTAAAGFLGMAWLIRAGRNPTATALVLLAIAATLLTKRTALMIVIPAVLALLWAFWREPISWRVALLGLPAALILPILIGFQPTTDPMFGVEARPWLRALDQAYLRLDIDNWLNSLFTQTNPIFYLGLLHLLITSFWARFSWSQITLGATVDWLVIGVTLLTLLGIVLRRFQLKPSLLLWQQRWIWLCILAIVCAWIAAILRIHPLPQDGVPTYMPRGRYMFWTMLPTLWLLAFGWQG
ncbi:MAG: hypothetical protein HC822_28405 [Oscillochloris sp.]|nr:hypothetical protein [Oscillochloris sp.]